MIIWRLDDENRAPKLNVGARQAGINKLKNRNSQTKGDNKGKPCKFRVACYTCPMVAADTVYVYVQSSTRRAVCKEGHVIDCSGGCK